LALKKTGVSNESIEKHIVGSAAGFLIFGVEKNWSFE